MSPGLRALMLADGSTRATGLVRILTALLLWTRFGQEMAPFHYVAERFPVLASLFWVSSTLMLVGYRARLSTGLAGLTMFGLVFWAGVHEGHDPYRHHHVYMLAAVTMWLALTPCGGSYSLDRWRAVRAAASSGVPAPPERGPTWATWVVLGQLSATYFWSAWDKTTPAFLSGARLVQIFLTKYGTSDIPFAGFEALCQVAAWATVLGEYALAVGVLVRWPLKLVVPAGLLLHALLYLLIPVSTFSASCMVLYLLVVDPDDLHEVIDRLHGPPEK